jgi:hypothetical protein
MNELQRLKQLQQLIANSIEGVPQVDALGQIQLRMLGDMQPQLTEISQQQARKIIETLMEGL